VALDPRDGAVLAMVSKPSYDPNIFVKRVKAADWNRIIEHKGRPLQNRCVYNVYPPGSAFKPFLYSAALAHGFTPATRVNDAPSVLPGGGAMLSAFASYTIEKKLADDPSEFGKGAIQGVAGPESANNAGAQTSFIPLLTLGIPENAVMALMVGAMTIHNIQPGPQVMTSNPSLFWGLIASMWIGNLMLVVLNLPMIGLWIKLLQVPYRLLYPAILLFCSIGVYSINNTNMDIMLTVLFGLLGVVFVKLECEPAPLLLGFVLGPMMEENLRRALLLSRGDPTVFFTRPLSAVMLLMAAGLVLLIVLPNFRKTREAAFQEE
jgi:TctA family transporter